MENPPKFPSDLKALNIRDRNRVRSILAENKEQAVLDLLDKLRKKLPWQGILQVERVLRNSQSAVKLPSLFPSDPQTDDKYTRLAEISPESQLFILNSLIIEHEEKLIDFCKLIKELNNQISEKKVEYAVKIFEAIRRKFGYSHWLLRKATLIKNLNNEKNYSEIDEFLNACGSTKNSIICTSLLHCYQPDTDYLTLKRSILNIASRGTSNQFSRDISRLSFHPHAKDKSDFSTLLQSALQSSLIDACIFLKINQNFATRNFVLGKELSNFLQVVENTSPNLEKITEMYLGEDWGELLFFKQSSAWFEIAEVVEARFVLDHFYDAPEATYLKIDNSVLEVAKKWFKSVNSEELLSAKLTTHSYSALAVMEKEGTYVRSAAFNFKLWESEGFFEITEKVIFDLMGVTQDLSKTSPPKFLRNLATINKSEIVKFVIYLLVAKRSRNERDDHQLRHILQNLLIKDYQSNIVQLFDAIAQRSMSVAEYAYEICTEDFIAKLSRITKSASQITETRARLHIWMGKKTKRKVYLDRARTILIDHQINRVRNEIDDNRIYVDAARFNEWVNDEIVVELNTLFGSLQQGTQKGTADAIQLINLISRCYITFCQNQVFGIASYLGRRIRHGTFKGHLYYATVSALESRSDFAALKVDNNFLLKWEDWKKEFESNVNEIIKERLHVESSTKKNGFLRTSIDVPEKYEIALACAKNIIQEIGESKSAAAAATLLIDYCWRLAEIDLKFFNGWLKGQKNNLMCPATLDEIKITALEHQKPHVLSLQREILRVVQDKLNSMSTWFKRPPNVSPIASLSLLFRAVVAEVQEYYPNFNPTIDDSGAEIELFGGAYHILYDSFYVAIFNAAKHGKSDGQVSRRFFIQGNSDTGQTVVCEIGSELRDQDSESDVEAKLAVAPDELADIDNAQIFEGRSGIRKLHQLARSDERFKILHITVKNRRVTLAFTYALGWVTL